MRFRFHPAAEPTRAFELDTAREQLITPEGPCTLRRQAFAVLQVLVQRAPDLVTISELLDTVWGRRALSSSALPQVIRVLRRALCDPADAPWCIETRHRRGYRFMVPVHAERARSTLSAMVEADAPQAIVARLHVRGLPAANDALRAHAAI